MSAPSNGLEGLLRKAENLWNRELARFFKAEAKQKFRQDMAKIRGGYSKGPKDYYNDVDYNGVLGTISNNYAHFLKLTESAERLGGATFDMKSIFTDLYIMVARDFVYTKIVKVSNIKEIGDYNEIKDNDQLLVINPCQFELVRGTRKKQGEAYRVSKTGEVVVFDNQGMVLQKKTGNIQSMIDKTYTDRRLVYRVVDNLG